MIVVIDTSVLSLAFRRRNTSALSPHETRIIDAMKRLAFARRAVLTGMVRQELLSGVRSQKQFEELKQILDGFVYLHPEQADHDLAASCFNRCREKGIAAGDIDMLLCALAIRRDGCVLTVDGDFAHYARCFPLTLYKLD